MLNISLALELYWTLLFLWQYVLFVSLWKRQGKREQIKEMTGHSVHTDIAIGLSLRAHLCVLAAMVHCFPITKKENHRREQESERGKQRERETEKDVKTDSEGEREIKKNHNFLQAILLAPLH